MMRRTKQQVLQQLPSKRRQRVVLDKLDATALKELKGKLREVGGENAALEACNSGPSVGAAAMELFQLTSKAKVVAVQEYIQYLVEADCRFLLFAHHKIMMDALQQTLEKQKVRFIRIDGATLAKKREILVEEFRNTDAIQVALLSITACGQGLNLQSCSTVVFAELHWTPGMLVQAEDRVHRMGQKRAVNIHYLIARNTLDDSMYQMLERKNKDVSVILDGREAVLGAKQASGHVGVFSTTDGMQVDLSPCNAACGTTSSRGRGKKRALSA